MAIIDNEDAQRSALKTVLFSLLAILFVFAAGFVCQITHTRRHYHGVWTVRFLFPLALVFCAVENLVIIVKGSKEFLNFVFVLQALQVPVFLVVIFELTYLVHKRRSVHFCGMSFDEGRLGERVHDVFTISVQSFLLRNVMRILSTLCLVLGVIANFDLLKDRAEKDPLAGRVGWWPLFDRSDDVYVSSHVIISLLPTLVLIVCSFFLSVALWRYGNNSAMVVHSRFINTWYFPMFGTILLAAGQLFSESWYPFMSNLGFLFYTGTLILLMKEIDKDIISTSEFTSFLKIVSEKGNQHSVLREKRNVKAKNQMDVEHQEEEISQENVTA